ERQMRRRFPGSSYNIEKTCKFLIDRMIDPALREAGSDPQKIIAVLLVPAMRAWAGQPIFIDYMKEKWPLISDLVKRLGQLVDGVPLIRSSQHGLDLAQRMEGAIYASPEPKEKKKPEPKKPEEKKPEPESEENTPEHEPASKQDEKQEAGESECEGDSGDG